MSGRYEDYKGSSRSTRDDSRQSKAVRREYKDGYFDKRRSRSRSRSPRRRGSPPRSSKYSYESPPRSSKYDSQDNRREHKEKSHEESPPESDITEEVPAPPPPPRITKISIGFTKPKAPIKMSIGGAAKSNPKPTVASVFNADDDDDEPEEMPAEAKMRMRNIGRETPTSAGPNSFGKTKQGFCDAKKVFEKNMKQAMETVEKPAAKFPQTIYKIKGP